MEVDWMRGRAGRIALSLMDRLGLWSRWERWLDPALERLLAARPGTFVDVGVHLGQTLLKVKRLSPQAAYVGFEPNLATLSQVRSMVRRRRLANCDFYPLALSAATGVAALHSRGGDSDAAASLVDGFRRDDFYAGSRVVSVAAGDDLLAATGRRPVGLVKIDVEGGELDVLRGLQGTLAGDRPPIFCEVLPVYDATGATGTFRLQRQEAMEEILRGLDYGIFRIARDGGLQPLQEIGVHRQLDLCDYLFLPAADLVHVADLVRDGSPSR
jgi:FkbM family methyltransferase